MYVEEMMALVRLSEHNEAIVADLAKTVLSLVEQLKDANLRADLAEASLELELKRSGELSHKLSRSEGGGSPRLPRNSFDFGRY